MLYDLCVVGAGLFGSAAARHASANPALKVVLIGPDEPTEDERRSRTVFSCHYDEGRITRVIDDDFIYEVLAKKSIERYQELERLSGISFYNPIGMLGIGEKDGHYQSVLKKAALAKNVSILPLSQEQIRTRYPYLSLNQNEVACLDENGAGYISARNMVKAQKKVAKIQGCAIVNGTVAQVSAPIRGESGAFHKILTEKGEAFLAKRVLVCAGAFTKFKPLIPHEENWTVRITVNQETAALVKVPPEEEIRLRSLPSIVYYGLDATGKQVLNSYILPVIRYPDGCFYLKIGHIEDSGIELKTLKEVQDWYCSKGSEEINRYVQKLKNMIPDLRTEGMVPVTCACCYTPNGVPYVDRVSPTVAAAFGGNGKGAKISDEIGRLAAELSVYGRWDSEIPKSFFEIVWNE